ncbi:probable polyol transporter 3 [Lotus japonicus]|uniref:probable polyol transporter 3 n=1 Tax=Lotus japonicus TaxID=34305 RepID=UPI00258A0162|nr:probable polyol transporter 3 [Lotus japonicus]
MSMEEKKIENGSGDFGDSHKRLNMYACASVVAASVIFALYGYVMAVMTGVLLFIKEDLQLSDLQVQFSVGLLHMSALPACMTAGRIADYIGRRYTIILTAIIFLVGSVLMGYGPSYPILMIGLSISGIGLGFSLIVAPVYCAEISPPSHRGFLTSFLEVSTNAGIALGYVSNYFFGKLSIRLGWRLMLVVHAVPSLALVALMLNWVESPRWLVMQGRVGEARKVLLLVSNTKEEAEQRLKEIKVAVGIDEKCTQDIVQVPNRTRNGGGAFREMFCKPTPPVRRILIAAVGVHAFQQLSGVGAILLYCPRIFETIGVTDQSKMLLATVGMGLSKLVFAVMSVFLLDRVGRRLLLLISSGVMAVSLLGLGSVLTLVENSNRENLGWALGFAIVATYTYVAFMTIGSGPVTWVYSSEILPLRLRAQGLSICVAVNRIIDMTMATSFISIYKMMTMGGTFFMLAGINVVAWSFYYFFLPETKGRSLEDMETIFGKRFKPNCNNGA